MTISWRMSGTLGLISCFLAQSLAPALEQELTLHPGWNLISLWVEPDVASPDEVFDGLPPGRLAAVFGFDGNGGAVGIWTRFQGQPPAPAPWLNDLGSLRPGRGYWVLLGDGPSVDVHVRGELLPSPTEVLERGWHLVGSGAARRALPWQDAFGSLSRSVGALYGYVRETGEFIGFEGPQFGNVDVNGDGAVEPNEFGWSYAAEAGTLRQLEPGAAYWLYVDQETAFGPVLTVDLESDLDALAEAGDNTWNPEGEDTDINGNGILDYGYTVPGAVDRYGSPVVNTQDTIWFRVPRNTSRPRMITRQELHVVNDGSGVLVFEIDSDVAGLVVEPTSGQVVAGEAGVPVRLAIDLGVFAPGEYEKSITVRSTGGEREIHVRISVPPIGGVYTGTVRVTQIGAKDIYLGEWPVELALGTDGGLLQSDRSIHFPGDVDLLGGVDGGSFDMVGNVTVAADDPANPYGKDYDRVIRFTGALSDSEGRAGVQLGIRGEYRESIFGLAEEPIELVGKFRLLPE